MADVIQTYAWVGMNSKGERIKGTIQALDINSAQLELKNRDVEVISIEKEHTFFSLGRKKIKTKEILYFTRYLSTMITAGVPILQCFDIIVQDQKNEELRTLVLSIRDNIASGKTLSESFSQFPLYFSPLYCNLIHAGEKSGTLGKILKRLADYLETTEKLKSKVKKALIYPSIVVFVALVVSLILLIFVVPQFETIFSSVGAKLPYFTQKVIGVSAFIRGNFLYILIAIILFFWLLKFFIRKDEKMAFKFDQFKLKIWVVGEVIRKGMLARFSNTLAITLEAGLPIVESMKSIANVVNNLVYKKAVLRVCEDLAEGHTLASSLQETKLFPVMMVQMVTVGEKSGSLPTMLTHINDYYEEEVTNTVDNLSSIIEPVIIVVLGVVIGSFVVAMYLPIFKLGSIF